MIRFLFLGLFAAFSGFGQTSPEKLAAIAERSKWSKAEQSIRKAQAKDTLNPEPPYLLSVFFFNANHPTYNVDSSSTYHRLAARLAAIRVHVKKPVPDSLSLLQLRLRIDSAAFETAKRSDTEEGYQHFVTAYAGAAQLSSAVELRDEVAFLKALKVNTSKSFKLFMERYPVSHRRPEAQRRMEKLEYEEVTSSKLLTSYARFYKEHPQSPYRPLAERNLFEMITASGDVKAFESFVKRYPESRWSKRAQMMLYELGRSEEGTSSKSWTTDSLRHLEKLGIPYWVPIIKSGRYGFIDERGTEMVAPRFASISEGYRCGEVRDRFLITSEGLLARNGSIFWPGRIREAKDLGLGFILISSDSGRLVIHESGFQLVSTTVQDAEVVANRFLGIQKNGKWSIISLVGKTILPFVYDNIAVLDSVIQLTKNRKRILTTPSRIARVASGKEFNEEIVIDDSRKWGEQHYWVRNGVLEGVIDANLNFLVPLDRQALRKTSFGFVTTKADKAYIKGIRKLENIPYQVVAEQAGWVRMQSVTKKHLLFDKGFGWQEQGDSVWFQGQLAFLQKGDSVTAFLPAGQRISFLKGSSFQFKEYRDSAAWMVLEEKKKKAVYDAASGVKLFTAEFDQIEPASSSLFILTRLSKKGLVQEDGKILLPLEYDAIVSLNDHSFTLLKDKKFGWFESKARLLVRPTYDRNLKPYNAMVQLAFKENGYGFILPDGKQLGLHEWEEIQFWSDSVAWVKKGTRWKMLNIYSQTIKLDNIKSFSYLNDSPEEKLALVQQDQGYGVISSLRGLIVPLQYTDIVNLGTKEIPLYFTERHISEAGISVVVYFDQRGKIIRRQAMEAEEFEKISCDN